MLPLNLHPDERRLRQFGFMALAGFGALGGLVSWRGGAFGLDFGAAAWPVACGLWALGVLAAALSLAAPRANRFLYAGLLLATWPIGWAVSNVLLALLFFGLIAPVGLALRLLGWDPLGRRFDRSAASYWQPSARSRDPERYFRQF